jgi:hypothetical protein
LYNATLQKINQRSQRNTNTTFYGLTHMQHIAIGIGYKIGGQLVIDTVTDDNSKVPANT